MLSTDTLSKILTGLKIKNKSPIGAYSNTDTNVISIVNTTGSRVDSYRALELESSIIESDQNDYFSDHTFDGITPTADTTRLAILLQPLEDDEVGQAVISGICTVEINVTDITHTSATSTGSNLLVSSGSGPITIIEPPTTTGTQFLKCVFGGGSVEKVRNGVVRGTSEENFDDNTPSVDVTITFSNLEDISVGQTVTATNYIGYSGDIGGECYVYYHGDGTGNEDGTFDLMGARCPV